MIMVPKVNLLLGPFFNIMLKVIFTITIKLSKIKYYYNILTHLTLKKGILELPQLVESFRNESTTF